jgi:4-alpha-glucanotransferase
MGTQSTPLFPWLQERAAGVLLHPTALPGPFGIGNLGEPAHRFVDFLSDSHTRYWQICPLGPTGYGDSPYQCFSAFAGNAYLIDLTPLLERHLLQEEEVAPLRNLPHDKVDFGHLYEHFWPVLRSAYQRFLSAREALADYGDFDQFRANHHHWLHPYALFSALKDHFGGKPWQSWPAEWRSYRAALNRPLSPELANAVGAHQFFQFLFYAQWYKLREYANRRGVGIIGDLPIFVALDSADTWSEPEIFQLDQHTGRPLQVAGVPPDYFSPLGQLWGNPLYDWQVLRSRHYDWWVARFRANFDLYDIVRLDHFRGFEAYWSVNALATDARQGRWEHGPGLPLFEAVHKKIPEARIIAEDLGLITEPVVALREATGLPGMAVLQFAFGSGSDNFYLPHNVKPNCVIYSGTHDNDTSLGWYESAGPIIQDEFRRYLRSSGKAPNWDMIHAAYKSVCRLAITPLQDILGLGSEARFNTPGTAMGNWQWRFESRQLDNARDTLGINLRDLADNSGRQPPPPQLAQRSKNFPISGINSDPESSSK